MLLNYRGRQQQSGVTVRALSELQFAFRDAGLEADDLDDTVFELNLKMGEARDGVRRVRRQRFPEG